MKAIYKNRLLVDVDLEEWSEPIIGNEIGRYVLCDAKDHVFYANKKDIKLAFDHYLKELER